METATSKMSQQKTPSSDDLSQETKNVTDSSPITPTASSSSSWWGGLISQAKEKSASVLQAVKNDLDEITTAVTETFQLAPAEEDTENEVSSENLILKQQQQQQQQQHPSTVSYMKQSLSSFFGTVTDALIPQLDDEDATEAVLITSDDTIVLTGFKKHLAELQDNDETYLEEPSKTAELAEKYRMWLEIVEQDQFTQQRVDKMLQSSQILNEKYNKFVPDTVSHMNFFKRYLFKKALLEDDLANEERRRKEEVVIQNQPETVSVVEPQEVEEEEEEEVSEAAPLPVIPADIGDLEIANFELSEEEQARLLSDYEQEIKEREKSKTETVKSPIKPAMKSKNQPKSTSNVQSSKGKNNKNVKFQQQQKSTQQQTAAKGGEKTKKGELKVDSNHFKKDVDSSSTSDESWEKEFDL